MSDIIVPSKETTAARDSAWLIGGPVGRFARIGGRGWWTPVRALIVLAAAAYLVGGLLDVPCMSNGWLAPDVYEHLCYSDIPPLYLQRGFADGVIPYLQAPPGGQYLEYPVLTGLFMQVSAWITSVVIALVPPVSPYLTFFIVNAILLFPFFVLTVVAAARYVRGRPWDAAMIALAPSIILAGLINWDLIPIGLSTAALLLWSRQRPGWAGVLLGLAIAAKFYPVILLGPWFLICLRAGRLRDFGRLFAGAAGVWLVVNVPVMIGNFEGWSYFYRFSQFRGVDWGSVWYAITLAGLPGINSELLNAIATGTFVVLCIGIAILIFKAPRRPRLVSVLFLVIAAFVMTNKVYSPQFAMWLVPLAVLARPRWRDFLIWQSAEVAYFIAIWWHLAAYGLDDAKGMTPEWYAFFTFVRVIVTAWYAGMVVRDIWHPEHDPVRSDRLAADAEDPGGGCLDGASDVVAWTHKGDAATDDAVVATSAESTYRRKTTESGPEGVV